MLMMYPEAAIAVDTEIHHNHPELLKLLSEYPNRHLESKVAAIAAYCGFVVDGTFREQDLEKLFQMLYDKLKEKSAIRLD
jgi:hypothetical protein